MKEGRKKEREGGGGEKRKIILGWEKFLILSPVPSALFLYRGEHPAAGAESPVSKHPGGRELHCVLQLLKHFHYLAMVQAGAWERFCPTDEFN